MHLFPKLRIKCTYNFELVMIIGLTICINGRRIYHDHVLASNFNGHFEAEDRKRIADYSPPVVINAEAVEHSDKFHYLGLHILH